MAAICVMGGSFNPPTLAHLRLMQAALEALQAEKGLFVPSSQEYVERKMKRSKEKALSEEVRAKMLARMCEDDPRLSVDVLEFGGGGKGRTYDTMAAIQEKYPEAELWFLLGGDKLSVVSRWRRSEEFLERFHILAADRGASLESAFLENPMLRRHRDRFASLKPPEETEEICSSRVRALLRKGDASAEKLVHPGVWELLLSEGWLSREITVFRGEYAFLSNFYEAPLVYDGLRYGSAEAAFQAQKCRTAEERQVFQDLRPSDAKRAGRKVPLRPDWEEVKVGLMEGIVRAKFTQNPELARLLKETRDLRLVEGNRWNDTCWGVDLRTGRGENHLGRILMEVRQELLSADASGD